MVLVRSADPSAVEETPFRAERVADPRADERAHRRLLRRVPIDVSTSPGVSR